MFENVGAACSSSVQLSQCHVLLPEHAVVGLMATPLHHTPAKELVQYICTVTSEQNTVHAVRLHTSLDSSDHTPRLAVCRFALPSSHTVSRHVVRMLCLSTNTHFPP